MALLKTFVKNQNRNKPAKICYLYKVIILLCMPVHYKQVNRIFSEGRKHLRFSVTGSSNDSRIYKQNNPMYITMTAVTYTELNYKN